MAAWLLPVWVLLWARLDAAVVVSGLAAVTVTYWATRLPPLPAAPRLRPRAVAVAALHFGSDLVVSSLVIARHAVWRPERVRGALIRVRGRSESDPVLVLVVNGLSLRPGTLVLDIDRRDSTLIVHAMPVRDLPGVERLRRGALDEEGRLIRAFGTPHDIEALRADEDGPPPSDEREER
jgi:multicomponent Na+:H+ antiporter subunit E